MFSLHCCAIEWWVWLVGFTFLVLAHPGSLGQMAVKRVCVCMCVCVRACVRACACVCVHCCAFSALTLLVGQQEGHLARKKTEWWGAGVVICLE